MSATIDALPGRPVKLPAIRALESIDGVAHVAPRFSVGDCRNPYDVEDVPQLAVVYEVGRAIALHLDPDRGRWCRVGVVDVDDPGDREQRDDAIAELDEFLKGARGDDAEYGRAISRRFR